MSVDERKASAPGGLAAFGVGIVQWLGSMQLAVVLIVILACVLSYATLVEGERGRSVAQWQVYHSQWFFVLMGLLAANILTSTLVRFPWRKRIPFLITHVGLLILMAGAVWNFRVGLEGQVVMAEGEASNRMILSDVSAIDVRWQPQPNKPARPADGVSVNLGPVDWPDGRTLDLGELAGVQVRVLKYIAHAKVEEQWIAASEGQGVPAVELVLANPGGKKISEQWLAASLMDEGQLRLGPMKMEIQRVAEESMAEDFVHPLAKKDMDPRGVLSMHYQGKMYRVPVGPNLGKKVPVGDTGIEVEIVHYRDLQPDKKDPVEADGKTPKNPYLDLRVFPAKDKPAVEQKAFATMPFFSMDGTHGSAAPVKFWYHHPAIGRQADLEFMVTPAGKLAWRAGFGDVFRAQADAQPGEILTLPTGIKISLAKFFPSAKKDVHFFPARLPRGEPKNAPEPATLLEVGLNGVKEEVWLRRADPDYGEVTLESAQGRFNVAFGADTRLLDFGLKLKKFKHEKNPGGHGDAAFASIVELMDPRKGAPQTYEISMNSPLTYGKYTFYLSSFQEGDTEQGGAPPVTILSAAYDPGWFLKYLGSLMACFGAISMFVSRTPWWKNLTRGKGAPSDTQDAQPNESLARIHA